MGGLRTVGGHPGDAYSSELIEFPQSHLSYLCLSFYLLCYALCPFKSTSLQSPHIHPQTPGPSSSHHHCQSRFPTTASNSVLVKTLQKSDTTCKTRSLVCTEPGLIHYLVLSVSPLLVVAFATIKADLSTLQ